MDETISNHDYPDSTTQDCPFENGGVVDWNVAGYKSFTAVAGIADNESYATGETVRAVFYDQDNDKLGAVTFSIGHPERVKFSLNGATRMQITCTVTPESEGFDITLGNAALHT